MQLLTEEDRALFAEKYPLYSQDKKRGDALVVLKYFLPGTAATWYILEGQPEGDDFIFFGYVAGLCPGGDEYGYISLKELESVVIRVPMVDAKTEKEIGLLPCHVEKDLYFTPKPIKEIFPDLWPEKKRK